MNPPQPGHPQQPNPQQQPPGYAPPSGYLGARSILFSILIGIGALFTVFSTGVIARITALFIVFSTDRIDKPVDFLPDGGTATAQGAEASSDLQHKVQKKKRSFVNKSMQ